MKIKSNNQLKGALLIALVVLGSLLANAQNITINNPASTISSSTGSIGFGTNSLTNAGTIGVGTSSPDASAVLDLTSTAKGMLIPRMTTTQRLAISSPANGLQVYDITLNAPFYYNGSAWVAGGSSAISGTTNYISKFTCSNALGNSLIYDNGTNVGIGTSSPLYLFDVAGTAHANSLFIANGPGNGITVNGTNNTITSVTGTVGFGSNNITTTGSINAGSLTLSSITVPIIYTDRIAPRPGDSSIALGDSSLHASVSPIINNIYGMNGPRSLVGSALGLDNQVTGAISTALGFMNTASGGQSVGIGTHNIVFGNQSILIGQNNLSLVSNSIVIGSGLTSTVFDANTIQLGMGSVLPSIYVSPAPTNLTAGNVGIGTKTPSNLLDINGTMSVSTSGSPNIVLWNNDGGAIDLGSDDTHPNSVSGGVPYIDFHYGNGQVENYNMRIINHDNYQMDFMSGYGGGGYVVMSLMGNSATPYVRAQEIRVCLTGCDFVFEKGYNLMGLKELDSYIQQNHHLPGIESAKEMENSDGVAIGKLNSKLLQKVEELTLYTIQLQKQVDDMQSLKDEVSQLKAELANKKNDK